ncbi:MAG: DNA adenine methylase [Deltaproteobacteria bacterium]|nr:DNA adenine methylase [Deltaproteobacteria bacterium]
MIKYLGSKRRLLALIETAILSVGDVDVVVDLFSGTSRVGQSLKRRGLRVKANDHNAYAHTLARCYVEADAGAVVDDVTRLVAELNALPGKAGWFTETYCERSRFFQPKNGAKIDVIRDAIAAKALDPVLEAVLLTSLMEAADRVDSTVGVQMAYLKSWAKRANNDLEMRVPEMIPASPKGACSAHRLDAAAAAAALSGDVVYLDPPYNVHSYLSNYHIWETLIAWDRPEVYGVACKRVDCRERKSRFNSRVQFKDALHGVIARLDARALVVSFSDEGYLTKDELLAILGTRGPVSVVEQSGFKRYVGAQIGIYNPSGAKVGAVSHTENTEYVFVVKVDTPPITMPRQVTEGL